MNKNHSSADVIKRPLPGNSDNGLYLWIIIGASIGTTLLLIIIIGGFLYARRRKRKKELAPCLPGSEFCPHQMISSYSSSASDDISEHLSKNGKHYRRPLGPSASLDPPNLLLMNVQPKPSLTRWHTVASPHCHTIALDAPRDSDEESKVHRERSTKGRLWFSMMHDKEKNILQVVLYKAKHLPGRGTACSPRDPFVKIYLLPDEDKVHQSKIRKRTLSPKFNETFVFEDVPAEELAKRTLKFSVYDVDKKKIRHSLGHVVYPLTDADKLDGRIMWKELESVPQTLSGLGEIRLSLSCDPYSNRIKVTVCRLRNLPEGITNSIYVKVDLYHGRKMVKSKQTATRDPLDLEFDESFHFAVSGRFFDSCSFSFTVIHGTTPLGRVVVGPFMYARGEQLRHWQEMLANPKGSVNRWHPLEFVE